MEKMDSCSYVRVEKIQGGIPFHEMYIFDTQEKTDFRNNNMKEGGPFSAQSVWTRRGMTAKTW